MKQEQPRKESHAKRLLKLFLKIAITVACLWYVSTKIDIRHAAAALRSSDWRYIFVALLLFTASKTVSAVRLNYYFRNIGIYLSEWSNLKLYWLGMYYNLFLPGSISGDAYKVIMLTKRYQVPYKRTTAAVLLDRFSGLLGLGLLIAVFSMLVLEQPLIITGIAVAACAAVAVLYLVIRRFFPYFLPSFWPTLLLGTLVQFIQLGCAWLLVQALGIATGHYQYLFIFLVSSVVAVLPFTIGGLGAREIVFLEGARYFGLVNAVSVVISLLFYLITAFISLWGLLYVFMPPLKKETPSPKTDAAPGERHPDHFS